MATPSGHFEKFYATLGTKINARYQPSICAWQRTGKLIELRTLLSACWS
jgi:hypothetical protein